MNSNHGNKKLKILLIVANHQLNKLKYKIMKLKIIRKSLRI